MSARDRVSLRYLQYSTEGDHDLHAHMPPNGESQTKSKSILSNKKEQPRVPEELVTMHLRACRGRPSVRDRKGSSVQILVGGCGRRVDVPVDASSIADQRGIELPFASKPRTSRASFSSDRGGASSGYIVDRFNQFIL